jgi:hypothetical protein
MASTTERKPQVNVQLEPEEWEQLEAICRKENIIRPALLVGVWIRENIKLHDGEAELMEVVREARASGVNVIEVLANARAKSRRK